MVSDVVFAHEEMRQKLDDIIHPAVKAIFWIRSKNKKGRLYAHDSGGCTSSGRSL